MGIYKQWADTSNGQIQVMDTYKQWADTSTGQIQAMGRYQAMGR